jgi:hypothetical protein
MGRARQAVRRSAVVLMVGGALMGCSGTASLRDREVSRDEIQLGDAVLAAFLSPQSVSFSRGTTGYLVLVDKDGEFRTLLTEPMDNGQPVWTNDGLFFADSAHDFLLDGAGLSVVESAKPDYQNGLVEVGGAVVGVYNHGFTGESGYRDVVVTFADGVSEATAVEGDYGVVADCGGELVGWSEVPGTLAESDDLVDLDDESSTTRSVLSRLWPGEQTVLGVHDAEGSAGMAVVEAPCLDGVVHVLGSRTVGEQDSTGAYAMAPVLLSWSTVTSEQVSHDLVDEDGEVLPLTVDHLSQAQYSSTSVAAGALRWLAPDGVVHSTDLATGVTRELFDTGISQWDGRSASSAFTGDDLYVMAGPSDSEGPLELLRFGLTDGSSEVVLTVDGVSSSLSVDLVLRGVALDPTVRAAG